MASQYNDSADRTKRQAEAILAAMQTLRFVLESIAQNQASPVTLTVSVRAGAQESGNGITYTCVGDTPEGQAQCEQFGIHLQDDHGCSCQSIPGGSSCDC